MKEVFPVYYAIKVRPQTPTHPRFPSFLPPSEIYVAHTSHARIYTRSGLAKPGQKVFDPSSALAVFPKYGRNFWRFSLSLGWTCLVSG